MDINQLRKMFDKSIFPMVSVSKGVEYRGYVIDGLTKMSTQRVKDFDSLGYDVTITSTVVNPLTLKVYCVKRDK